MAGILLLLRENRGFFPPPSVPRRAKRSPILAAVVKVAKTLGFWHGRRGNAVKHRVLATFGAHSAPKRAKNVELLALLAQKQRFLRLSGPVLAKMPLRVALPRFLQLAPTFHCFWRSFQTRCSFPWAFGGRGLKTT